jgi:diguanylate cyclase (GGDEF)-like protein
MKIKRINGRFLVKSRLAKRGSRQELAAADSAGASRLCALALWLDDAEGAEGAFERYNRLRSIVCPPLIRPLELHRVLSIDGRAVEGGGWLYTRPYVPGATLEHHLDTLTPDLLLQYLEADRYLSRAGFGLGGVPLDALIAEEGSPRLRVAEISGEDREGLMENVAAMAAANAEAGGDLSELDALITSGQTSRPEHVMKYLTETFNVRPAAQFVESLPSRLMGYHRQLMRASTCFMRSSEEPPVVILHESRGQHVGGVVYDLMARAEARGWHYMLLGNAGVEDLGDFIRRRVSELLGDWEVFSGAFSETRGAAEMLARCGGVHPICLCMTLHPRQQEQVPQLVQALRREGAEDSVALVIRLRADVLPGRVELPGTTVRLDDRRPPDPAALAADLLGTDTVPPGLEVTLQRFGATEPEDLLPAVRSLVFRRLLRRDGPDWRFVIDADRAKGMPADSGISLSSILRLEGLGKRALALLVHAGQPLGARMVAHTVDADPSETEETMEVLEKDGLVRRVVLRRKRFWRAVEGIPLAILVPDRDPAKMWNDRLIRFALSHPSPGLSELLAAIRLCGDEPAPRANLLYDTFLIAGEGRDSELIGRLLPEIMDLPPDSLSANQIRNVLEMTEPRDLPGLDVERAREVFAGWREMLPEGEGRVLADIRLAELDIMDGRDSEAMSRMDSTVDQTIETGGEAGKLGLCLRVLSEMQPGKGSVEAELKTVRRALQAIPEDASPSEKTVALSRGALALSVRGRSEDAAKLLAGAESLAGAAGPDAKQVWEWCRGRVLLARSLIRPAVEALEKALLLAENRGDRSSVAKILDLTATCQERLPGYTLRGIVERIEGILTPGAGPDSGVYRFHSLSRLYALHIRMLRPDRAEAALRDLQSMEDLPEEPQSRGLLEWFRAFWAYQTGGRPIPDGGELLLPGTTRLLQALADGTDPEAEALAVADVIRDCSNMDVIVLGLYLALETAAHGRRDAAKQIAMALTVSYRPRMDELIPAWRLCINGLLAPRETETEKALASAQTMARQLDRLLLVWLVLQVRLELRVRGRRQRDADLHLMLEELDRFIEDRLSPEVQARFKGLPRLAGRREELLRLGGSFPESLPQLRDEVAEALRLGERLDLSAFSGLPAETSRTSSVGWGLEALRAFAHASRVMVMRVTPEDSRVLESRGFGTESPPSAETMEAIREGGGTQVVLDSFGQTPFGSRFTHIIPLGHAPHPGVPERRRKTDKTPRGNFLVIEVDSAFETLSGPTGKVLRCFSKQISAALSLRQLERQTYFDSMTGAVIRRMWMARLRDLLDTWMGPGRSLALVMIDLDYFKSVNDTFGHREGDRVLKSVVSAMRTAVRPNDIVGRLGGEEFGILLPSASENNAVMVAERIRRRVETKVRRPDRRPVTISLGVSCAPAHGDSAELLVRRADVALYESKRSGRNRTTLWNDSMASTVRARDTTSLLDTGDPGWDVLLAGSIIKMLAAERLTVSRAAHSIRDVLRCEFLSLKVPGHREYVVGPREIGNTLEPVEPGSPGHPREGMGSNWQFYTLAVKLGPGGSLTAAWPANESRPRNLPTLFGFLAGLVEMLQASDRLRSEERREGES